MAEPEDQNNQQQPEVTPPVEPVTPDPDYKALHEESQRKLQETEQARDTATQLNTQYAQALGQQQAPPPTNDIDELKSQYDQNAIRLMEHLAAEAAKSMKNQTVNEILLQSEANGRIPKDPAQAAEFNKFGQEELNSLNQSPAYGSWTPEQKMVLASERANNRLIQKQIQSQQTQALQTANQQQAQGASLPGTGGSSLESGGDKEAWIREYSGKTETQSLMRRMYSEFRPGSNEYNEKVRKIAEKAFTGVPLGGKTGMAMEFLSGQRPYTA